MNYQIQTSFLPIIGAVEVWLCLLYFIYLYNYSDSTTLNGWAIPSATDIAFSLGVLSLLGKRVPISLKVFLTALAIIDDLRCYCNYSFLLFWKYSIYIFSFNVIAVIVLIGLNKFKINNFLTYLIVGIFLWDFTHQSGIHATIAGVLLALTIPHN